MLLKQLGWLQRKSKPQAIISDSSILNKLFFSPGKPRLPVQRLLHEGEWNCFWCVLVLVIHYAQRKKSNLYYYIGVFLASASHSLLIFGIADAQKTKAWFTSVWEGIQSQQILAPTWKRRIKVDFPALVTWPWSDLQRLIYSVTYSSWQRCCSSPSKSLEREFHLLNVFIKIKHC